MGAGGPAPTPRGWSQGDWETPQAPASCLAPPTLSSQQQAPSVSTSREASSAVPLAAPPSGEAAGAGSPLRPVTPVFNPAAAAARSAPLAPFLPGPALSRCPSPAPPQPSPTERALCLKEPPATPWGPVTEVPKVGRSAPCREGEGGQAGSGGRAPKAGMAPSSPVTSKASLGAVPSPVSSGAVWSGQCTLWGKSLGLEMCFWLLSSRSDGGECGPPPPAGPGRWSPRTGPALPLG